MASKILAIPYPFAKVFRYTVWCCTVIHSCRMQYPVSSYQHTSQCDIWQCLCLCVCMYVCTCTFVTLCIQCSSGSWEGITGITTWWRFGVFNCKNMLHLCSLRDYCQGNAFVFTNKEMFMKINELMELKKKYHFLEEDYTK